MQLLIGLGLLLATGVLVYVSGRNWLVFAVLIIPAYTCGEWISTRLSDNGLFRGLSTEEAGFSIFRILKALNIAVPLFVLIMIGVYGTDFLLRLIGK